MGEARLIVSDREARGVYLGNRSWTNISARYAVGCGPSLTWGFRDFAPAAQ